MLYSTTELRARSELGLWRPRVHYERLLVQSAADTDDIALRTISIQLLLLVPEHFDALALRRGRALVTRASCQLLARSRQAWIVNRARGDCFLANIEFLSQGVLAPISHLGCLASN